MVGWASVPGCSSPPRPLRHCSGGSVCSGVGAGRPSSIPTHLRRLVATPWAAPTRLCSPAACACQTGAQTGGEEAKRQSDDLDDDPGCARHGLARHRGAARDVAPACAPCGQVLPTGELHPRLPARARRTAPYSNIRTMDEAVLLDPHGVRINALRVRPARATLSRFPPEPHAQGSTCNGSDRAG
jgi:hypothetical protein